MGPGRARAGSGSHSEGPSWWLGSWAYLLVSFVAGAEGAVYSLQAQAEVGNAMQPHDPPGRDVFHARRRHGLHKLQRTHCHCQRRYRYPARNRAGPAPPKPRPMSSPRRGHAPPCSRICPGSAPTSGPAPPLLLSLFLDSHTHPLQKLGSKTCPDPCYHIRIVAQV